MNTGEPMKNYNYIETGANVVRKSTELEEISGLLEENNIVTYNLLNELKNIASKLSNVKNMGEEKITDLISDAKPKSLVETLSGQLEEQRQSNNTLKFLVNHFNEVV